MSLRSRLPMPTLLPGSEIIREESMRYQTVNFRWLREKYGHGDGGVQRLLGFRPKFPGNPRAMGKKLPGRAIGQRFSPVPN